MHRKWLVASCHFNLWYVRMYIYLQCLSTHPRVHACLQRALAQERQQEGSGGTHAPPTLCQEHCVSIKQEGTAASSFSSIKTLVSSPSHNSHGGGNGGASSSAACASMFVFFSTARLSSFTKERCVLFFVYCPNTFQWTTYVLLLQAIIIIGGGGGGKVKFNYSQISSPTFAVIVTKA